MRIHMRQDSADLRMRHAVRVVLIIVMCRRYGPSRCSVLRGAEGAVCCGKCYRALRQRHYSCKLPYNTLHIV